MAIAPSLGVPELAGIASYKEATKIGFSVEENVRRLLRYQWVEWRLAGIITARIAETPEWEVKGGFSLHQWLDIEHAELLRRRIREMRHPMPRIDVPPDEFRKARPGFEAKIRRYAPRSVAFLGKRTFSARWTSRTWHGAGIPQGLRAPRPGSCPTPAASTKPSPSRRW